MDLHRAATDVWKAHHLLRQGRIRAALGLYDRAASVFAAAGSREAEAEARANAALCWLGLGEPERAERGLQAALRGANPRLELAVREALAGILADRGELDAAAVELDRAAERAEALSDRAVVALARAGLHHDRGELDHGLAFASEAMALARQAAAAPLVAGACLRRAALLQERCFGEGGSRDAADAAWQHAVATAEASGGGGELAEAALGLGGYLLERGDLFDADAALAQAAALAEAREDPYGRAAACARRAVVAGWKGEEAGSLLATARQLRGRRPLDLEVLELYEAAAQGRPVSPPPELPRIARVRFALRLVGANARFAW